MTASIPTLHRIFLRSTLSFRPLIAPICALARDVLPERRLPAATEAMQQATTALRVDGERPALREAFEAAREALTTILAEADGHGLFADLVVADLIGIEGGQSTGLSMNLDPPPARNLPFLLYVTRVRRNHLALWTATQ